MRVSVRDLRKTYLSADNTEVVALNGVSVDIESGQFVALVGPSGCGKTTLLDIVANLTDRSSGSVALASDNESDPARPGVVFQDSVLMPWRTALENVLLPAELGIRRRHGSRAAAATKARAMSLLALTGLEGFENKYPRELSGGMQQRVAIARALLLKTGLLLMDEPFSALDEFTREALNLELLRIWHEQKFTTMFVTHNIFEAVFLSDRVLVMTPRPGRIVEDVEVRLPRPRTREMIATDEFSAEVRRIRSALQSYWSDAATPVEEKA